MVILKEFGPLSTYLRLKHSFVFISAALFILFFVWRFSIFTFTHPAYFLDTYEEIYRGTVARELTLNTPLPIWFYRPDNYAGGFYAVVMLLPFFYFFLGPTMLALKAFGIVQTALTLAVWYAVLARYVNRRTAILFSLLYIFAPFHIILLSSQVLGDHAETCLLSALTALLFFRIREYPAARRSFSYGVLGLLAGFSLWFGYIYGLTLAGLLVFLLWNRCAFQWKTLALLAVGFFVGFSFWLIFNFHERFSGLIIQGGPFGQMFDLNNFWKPFLIRFFEDSAGNYFSLYDLILCVQFASLAIFALLFLLRARKDKGESLRSRPAGLALVYTVIFFSVQQIIDRIGGRFLVVAYPFALVFIAFGFSELSSRRLRVFGMTTLIGLSLLGILPRFTLQHAGEYLSRKGYSVKTLGHATGIRPQIEKVLTGSFSALNAEDKADYIMTYVEQLGSEELSDPARASEKVDPFYRKYFEFLTMREEKLRDGTDKLPDQDSAGIPRELALRKLAFRTFERHLGLYSSPLVWEWNETMRALDSKEQRIFAAAFAEAVHSSGLPEGALPLARMKKAGV